MISQAQPDGTVVVKTCRDTAPRPRDVPRVVKVPKPMVPELPVQQPTAPAGGNCIDSFAPRMDRHRVAARRVHRRRLADEDAATARRVNDIAAAAVPRDVRLPSAADRVSEVRRRVLARLAGASSAESYC